MNKLGKKTENLEKYSKKFGKIVDKKIGNSEKYQKFGKNNKNSEKYSQKFGGRIKKKYSEFGKILR